VARAVTTNVLLSIISLYLRLTRKNKDICFAPCETPNIALLNPN
jgi:hypothetical protein